VTDHAFDLLAAALRADAGDSEVFLRALASKLEGALPDHVVVRRKRRLLGGAGPIEMVAVTFGDERLELGPDGRSLVGRRVRVVRDIAISNDELTVDEWIDALSRRLAEEAESSERARMAMERILGLA
jgi:hypothetical protein